LGIATNSKERLSHCGTYACSVQASRAGCVAKIFQVMEFTGFGVRIISTAATVAFGNQIAARR
jgi:hypothetical protein